MTMTTTAPFWTTIEAVPGLATDRLDWRSKLGASWRKAKPYLVETPRLVSAVGCPSPGGEHCPRRVVRHADGSIRAVCGDPERLCRPLDLAERDIRIFEVDRPKLLGDLAAALSLTRKAHGAEDGPIVHLGDHDVSAGRGFPVFVSLSSPRCPLTVVDVADLDRRRLPFILLVPSLGDIAGPAASAVRAAGGRVLTLTECVSFADEGGFLPTMPLDVLFASEIRVLGENGSKPFTPVMTLPVGTGWGELTFAFVSNEVLNVSYRKEPARRFEPDALDMKDGRDGSATRQWRLLRLCAQLGGFLPKSLPPRQLEGKKLAAHMLVTLREFERGYNRQRQMLAKALKEQFGIAEDPFEEEGGWLKARFCVDASGLKQGRADQRERNFADDD
jgi:hypothetical protein